MREILEKLKTIPVPIWIGLGLVLILIILMGNKSNQNQTASSATPVTGNTVGSSGAQAGAGTDQQLGNLSQMTQTGFNQIAQQEGTNAGLLQQINDNLTGIGTTMQQFGSSIQTAQNASATANASNGTVGQNSGSSPSPMQTPPTGGSTSTPSNHTLVGHYQVALPGGGNVTVNANSPQAAIENAGQETGMDTTHSPVTTLMAPRSDLAA